MTRQEAMERLTGISKRKAKSIYEKNEELDKAEETLKDIDALDMALAFLSTSYCGWISVKDRLPEKRGKYAVIIDGLAETATYEPDFEEANRWGNWYEPFYDIFPKWESIEGKVTHWLPLPYNEEMDIAKMDETAAKAKSMLLGRILMCSTILDSLDYYGETPELARLSGWITETMNRYQGELDYLERRSTDEIHSD